MYLRYGSSIDKNVMSKPTIIVFNKAVFLRQAEFPGNKVLASFRLIPWCSRSIIAYCIIIAVTLVVLLCLDGDWSISIEESLLRLLPLCYILPCCHLPLEYHPSLEDFTSGMMCTLVRMHGPRPIRPCREQGALGLAGLLGWVSLIDLLCCSQEDISVGMDLGGPNCVGKDVSSWFYEKCS